MKKSKDSDAQIMAILKQAENGVPVAGLCREHGMSSASFCKFRSKYCGIDASLMARTKVLVRESELLKAPMVRATLANAGTTSATTVSIANWNRICAFSWFAGKPLPGENQIAQTAAAQET